MCLNVFYITVNFFDNIGTTLCIKIHIIHNDSLVTMYKLIWFKNKISTHSAIVCFYHKQNFLSVCGEELHAFVSHSLISEVYVL